jgi:hypothetical protein
MGCGNNSRWQSGTSKQTRDLMKSISLTQLVSNICVGNYCQADLLQFINLAQKISLSYLKFQELLGKRISGEQVESDGELEDLAIDCIAELFGTDGNGRFPQLKKYYEQKIAELVEVNDAEVMVLTRRLIIRKTKQELSRIFRERDPEGAKIVRNIKVAIRSSEKLQVYRDMGKEFVFYTNGAQIAEATWGRELVAHLRKDRPPIPEDLLHARFLDIYSPNDSVSTAIRKLLEFVHSLDDFQNCLPMDAIIKLLRSIKFEAFRERLLNEDLEPTPLDHLESKEIESYIGVVMNDIRQKIQDQYVDTGKLDDSRAETYYKALRDVLYDLIQKKDNSSYYRNLKFYLPELSQREYRQQERSVFEYLAKVAKREFRKHLKELL